MKNNTPKLRFKEFTDEWQEKKLGDSDIKVIDGDRGTNYPNGNDFSNVGYCLFLNAKNVTSSGFSFSEKYFINEQKDSELRKGKLKEKDLVLTTRGTIGNFAFFDQNMPYKNMRINSGMVVLRADTNKVNPNYLYLFSRSSMLVDQIKRISFGSAQPQLTVRDIQKLKLPIPSVEEQEKIAGFLGAVDEKITKLEKKKKGFEKYKKGVMQVIFSQEIRFKRSDGSDYPDWEERKLGDLTRITTGSSNREDSTAKGDYTFFDRSEDIRASSQYLFDTEAVIVAGEGQEFRPKYFIGKFDLHQRTYAIMNFKSIIGKFAFYYMLYNRKYFNKVAVGTTVPSLRLPMFTNFPVQLPYIREQEKIAEFLTSLDNKVDLINKELDQAKLFKKSLLQQMFV